MRKSAEERGYGREHRAIRKQVLVEEPLCRACLAKGRVRPTTIADHIIPMSKGGPTVRSNYQGLCRPCSDAKTAAEGHEAQR
jgi:5-methylcytosine-specific restriction enzyme A